MTDSNIFGPEGETRGFVDSMDRMDEAIRMMTAMLNRFNRAEVYIGITRDGEHTGIDVSEEDVRDILERMDEKVNHRPDVSVTLQTLDECRRYILISAEGYETPYSFGSWFYVRRYRYIDDSEAPGIVWTENLTCGMKRHRSHSFAMSFRDGR